MGFAISLRSDHPSADRIRALWSKVEPFEDEPSMRLLGYPPHVTLAIYDDDGVREEEVREALGRAGRSLRALTLTFDAVCSFEGPPMDLWARPRPNAALQEIHRTIHAAIDPAACKPHYRPGTWIPHCTLGTQVREDRREAASAYAARPRDPFEVTFDALDAIRFPPIAPLELRRLF